MILQDIADFCDTADRTVELFFIGVLVLGIAVAVFWLFAWLWSMFSTDQDDVEDDLFDDDPDGSEN